MASGQHEQGGLWTPPKTMLQGRQTMLRHLVLALVCSAQLISARRYTVGNESGWSTGVNYTKWASGTTFFVGDSLNFEYVKGDHNVLQVDENTFSTCKINKTIANYTNGHTTVQLESTGMYFYVCGVGDHCLEGQKLKMLVYSELSPAPATSVPGLSPQKSDASPPLTIFKQHILTILASCCFPGFVLLIPWLHPLLG